MVFRPATYADRNFYGRIIGGLHPAGLNPIEIYTTLVTDNNRVYETHIPAKAEGIVGNLLHEIAHRIWRLAGKQPSNSFYARTYKADKAEPSEKYADQFTAEHLEAFKDRLKVHPLDFLPFADNTDPDRRVGELEGCGEYLDLEDEIKKDIFSAKDLRGFGKERLKAILGRAAVLVKERKLGMHEYNYLMARLKVAFAERGTRAQAGLIERWRIKPPS